MQNANTTQHLHFEFCILNSHDTHMHRRRLDRAARVPSVLHRAAARHPRRSGRAALCGPCRLRLHRCAARSGVEAAARAQEQDVALHRDSGNEGARALGEAEARDSSTVFRLDPRRPPSSSCLRGTGDPLLRQVGPQCRPTDSIVRADRYAVCPRGQECQARAGPQRSFSDRC